MNNHTKKIIITLSKRMFIKFSNFEIIKINDEIKLLEKQLKKINKMDLSNFQETFSVCENNVMSINNVNFNERESKKDLINSFFNVENNMLKVDDK